MTKFSIVLLAISLTLISLPSSASAGPKESGFGNYHEQSQVEKSENAESKDMRCNPFPGCAVFVEETVEISVPESNQAKKNIKSNAKSKTSI